jgi:hypothetical protein
VSVGQLCTQTLICVRGYHRARRQVSGDEKAREGGGTEAGLGWAQTGLSLTLSQRGPPQPGKPALSGLGAAARLPGYSPSQREAEGGFPPAQTFLVLLLLRLASAQHPSREMGVSCGKVLGLGARRTGSERGRSTHSPCWPVSPQPCLPTHPTRVPEITPRMLPSLDSSCRCPQQIFSECLLCARHWEHRGKYVSPRGSHAQ